MILIAEIDLATAAAEAYYLLREGYDVRTVKSGRDLINEAENNHPELIIMDVLLPDMNGLEIAKALKANEKTANIPILIYSFLNAPERALASGADAFLLKPIKPAKMMGIVKELLASRKSEGD